LDQQTPPRHASVNLVYDRKPPRYAEDSRIRIGKYAAEVTNNKDCARGVDKASFEQWRKNKS